MRIHAPRAFLPPGVPHVPLLYPFWGLPAQEADSLEPSRFEGWLAAGPAIVELVEPAEADVVVFPASWERVTRHPDGPALAAGAAALAAEHGKPLLVFEWSDFDDPVPVPGAVVYRTTLYRSRRRPGEHALPAWSEDLLARERGGDLALREWRQRPVVGFCGFAPGLDAVARPRLPRRAVLARYALGRAVGRRSDATVRRAALTALAASARVDTNFVVRDSFWAHAERDGRHDLARMRTERREYVEVSHASDYVLCARGAGNFSYRLYETLSLGRVPVFVDTDCVLPFDDRIDWSALTVLVDERDLRSIGHRVADFHLRLGSDGFRELQIQCRRVWERHLRPEGFFATLGDELRTRTSCATAAKP